MIKNHVIRFKKMKMIDYLRSFHLADFGNQAPQRVETVVELLPALTLRSQIFGHRSGATRR